ncbi:MAG: hypothetical protein Fur0042_15550 [Cyanophyceae cyanobacterium]
MRPSPETEMVRKTSWAWAGRAAIAARVTAARPVARWVTKGAAIASADRRSPLKGKPDTGWVLGWVTGAIVTDGTDWGETIKPFTPKPSGR